MAAIYSARVEKDYLSPVSSVTGRCMQIMRVSGPLFITGPHMLDQFSSAAEPVIRISCASIRPAASFNAAAGD
jgi:hypothetical protein